MNTRHDTQRIKDLAYRIWEEQGCPEGHQEDHWAEAQRRLDSEPEVISENLSSSEGLAADNGTNDRAQDTPGRPKSASSRQQTQPGQTTQTGSAELDSRGTSSPSSRRR